MLEKLKNINFKISKNIKYWIIAPLAVVLLAGIMFGIFAGVYKDVNKGMNIGIDFAGGSLVTVTLGNEVLTSDTYNSYEKLIKEAIENSEIGEKVSAYAKTDDYKNRYNKTLDVPANAATAKVTYTQTSGKDADYAIVFKYDNVSKTYDEDNTLSTYRNDLIKEYIVKALMTTDQYKNVDVDNVEDMISTSNIGATASAELIKTALICLAVSLVIILVYIIVRFQIWSGIAAVVALAHDVAILVALTIIFHIQVNSSFVAAIITIVAYSINNTIVVFDRLRENIKNAKKLGPKFDEAGLIDASVKQTFTRSVNSTLTTMVTIVLFAIFGSATVNEFALPVVFGLLAGFYSSMFIAPSLYYVLSQAWTKHKEEKKNKAKEQASKPKYAGAKQ